MLTIGDNVYPLGLESEYERALFRPFGSLMRRVALWPTLGNHDYGNEGAAFRRTADAYFRNFVLPRHPGRERFYSFRYANAEFLAIDSEVTSFAPGSRQYRWIDATLRRSRACWKIPYFHHPAHAEYVNPSAEDVAKLRDLQRWLVPLFERHGVKLVLSGARAQLRPQQEAHRRPPHPGASPMCSPAAAAPRSSPCPRRRVRSRPHAAGSSTTCWSRSPDGSMRVRAIDTAGRVRDRFGLTCGP